jgi:hypothetical protein
VARGGQGRRARGDASNRSLLLIAQSTSASLAECSLRSPPTVPVLGETRMPLPPFLESRREEPESKLEPVP